MSGSNAEWGHLAEANQELADAWDSCESLPEPGGNPVLDSFCARKRLDIPALVRIGARLSSPNVLAVAYNSGIKYRDMQSGQRWNYLGSEFIQMKIVRHGTEPSDTIFICEGETDAARVAAHYPVDVAIMPAGARAFTDRFADQIVSYDRIIIGLDNDEAGNAGALKIAKRFPSARRLVPPDNAVDWCDTEELPPLPEPSPAESIIVWGEELLKMDVPEVASWFEHDLLPIGGFLMLHGWAKSFKTYISLDMLSALAQGEPWCNFESTEEPTKVVVVQFELGWPYYRRRAYDLRRFASHVELWDRNFGTFTPIQRPHLTAGNKQQEDYLRGHIVKSGAQVVLIDPVRRAIGTSDMNSEAEVRPMLRFFESLQDEGLTVVATHHDNKASARAGGGDPTSMTGSGAWYGDPDTIVSITVPRGETYKSPRRNLEFLLRNSPSIPPRGMSISEDGKISYSEAHGYQEEGEDDQPAI